MLLLLVCAVVVALVLRLPMPAAGGRLLPREWLFFGNGPANALHGLLVVVLVPLMGILGLQGPGVAAGRGARTLRIGLILTLTLLVWYVPLHLMMRLAAYQDKPYMVRLCVGAGLLGLLALAAVYRARRRPAGFEALSFGRGAAATAAGILCATLLAHATTRPYSDLVTFLVPVRVDWSTTTSALAFNASAAGLVLGGFAVSRHLGAPSETGHWVWAGAAVLFSIALGGLVGWARMRWVPLVEIGGLVGDIRSYEAELSGALCLPLWGHTSWAALVLAAGHVLWIHQLSIPRAGLPLTLAMWMPLVGLNAGLFHMLLWGAFTLAGDRLHRHFGTVPVFGLRLAALGAATIGFGAPGEPWP